MVKKHILFLITLLGTSCAQAPFTSTKSAVSLGKGNWQTGTSLSPTFTMSATRGVTDRLDMGIVYEVGLGTTIALWSKYALLDKKKNWALALNGGGFQSSDPITSRGFFIGPIASVPLKYFEVYLSIRHNYVDWELENLTAQNRNDLWFSNPNTSGHTTYLQTVLGFNIWISDKVGINIKGQYLSSSLKDSEYAFDDNFLPGFEFIARL